MGNLSKGLSLISLVVLLLAMVSPFPGATIVAAVVLFIASGVVLHVFDK